MIIVQGVFSVAPDDRDQYLAESLETQRISRGEHGCIEYAIAPDPLDPARIVLSERWETRDDLDAHATALTERRRLEAEAGVERVALVSQEISFFEASLIEMG